MRKIWHFLWKEDSLLSWIVNIIIAFILIKFIIYPGLGLVLGTNLPVVAVISESMEHDGSFDEWWASPAICSDNPLDNSKCTQGEWYAKEDITKEDFIKYPFKNGFNKGDIIVLRGVDIETLEVGEIIVFQSGLNYPIIHRAIENNDVVQTKGDHNQAQIVNPKLNEKYITKDQLIGKAWFRIPYLGYVKIWFVDFLRCITFNGCYFS
ncbi:MAG: signal peptidase I [Candidatus Woesearchaeota archaeon]